VAFIYCEAILILLLKLPAWVGESIVDDLQLGSLSFEDRKGDQSDVIDSDLELPQEPSKTQQSRSHTARNHRIAPASTDGGDEAGKQKGYARAEHKANDDEVSLIRTLKRPMIYHQT
jgi:hypothetical protein